MGVYTTIHEHPTVGKWGRWGWWSGQVVHGAWDCLPLSLVARVSCHLHLHLPSHLCSLSSSTSLIHFHGHWFLGSNLMKDDGPLERSRVGNELNQNGIAINCLLLASSASRSPLATLSSTLLSLKLLARPSHAWSKIYRLEDGERASRGTGNGGWRASNQRVWLLDSRFNSSRIEMSQLIICPMACWEKNFPPPSSYFHLFAPSLFLLYKRMKQRTGCSFTGFQLHPKMTSSNFNISPIG